jgi:hypothetical protein
MDQAGKQYADQLREYDRVIDDAILKQDLSRLPKIRELNAALGKTINKLIEDITYLKKDTPEVLKTRDELLDKLRKIQRDYNGLKANTDQLETLRRIRKEQSRESNSELYLYLLFFLAVALCIVILVFFMSGQKKDATAPIASIPPIAATLV